ncbi:hypothetical protein TNCV_2964492 [Trichonephila clavipes]|nr:hypothetical protein TNCV_2964492 [Trichonephila clavipes]
MLLYVWFRSLFTSRMIYWSSLAVIILGRPQPTFLTAIPVIWRDFKALENTFLSIPNSCATLVDEAIAGPSCSRDTFLYLPKKLDFGYLGVPSTSSQSSFTEQLSSPEQLECKREDENEDNEPEMPHGTIILLR